MSLISLFFLLAGALLLILGFKKNNRALLTAAAFLWLAHGSWSEFSDGFKDGITAASTERAGTL